MATTTTFVELTECWPVVRQTKGEAVMVSTIELVPVVVKTHRFETVLFQGDEFMDATCRRFATRDEALAYHDELLGGL